jgi:hypothetical protein
LLHHVTKGRNRPWTIAAENAVELLDGEAVMEAVDDVVVGNVRECGAGVEETFQIRP